MQVNLVKVSIIAGPMSAAVAYFSLPGTYFNGTGDAVLINYGARVAIALAVWMAFWWITEAIPMAVTALLPLIVFPILGIGSFKASAQAYAHPLIFLFLGGFIVSIALQKWGLHRRFAVSLLRRVGNEPAQLVGGFMLATAVLSMWMSNTATTIMMLPIALSVIGGRSDNTEFAKCLLLGIAYSASIGGMATLIGTPPNLFVASYFNDVLQIDIGFLRWMLIGVPCSVILLPSAWLYLTRFRFVLTRSANSVDQSVSGAGLVWRELDFAARATLIIFLALVSAWLLRPLVKDICVLGYFPFINFSDAAIALIAAATLFAFPVDVEQRKFILDWADTRDLPWGTLILFGGGLSLAASINSTGADQVIGQWISRTPGYSPIVLIAMIVALVIFLTELTSNIATTATLVPVLAASAPLLGLDVEVVVPLIALAASCAFMLPVATPPNAIIFSSGLISGTDMAKAGLMMNVLALLVITSVGYLIIPLVWY
ncbi:MAG: sodium-dependent dicarboxylate transporter 2/3/5 [Gammaproteobacteria bacterium]|jgi:sodium-dependent dicarboxylate transporter 2/3/5